MANPPLALTSERARDRATAWVWARNHPFIVLFLAALALRVALVALSDLFEGFVLDDGTYHQMATDMAAGEIGHWDDFTYSLYWRTAAFLGPVTLLYKIFGSDIVVGQVYVAFLGAVTVVVATRLALELVSLRKAMFAGWAMALVPSQAFWSSQLMKDASVWLALVTLALLIAIGNRSRGRQLVLCGIAVAGVLCVLAFLREHTLVVAAWATMIAALAGIKAQWIHRLVGALVLGVTVPWLVAASGPAGLGLVTNAGSLEELRFKMAQGANTGLVDTTPGGTEAELNAAVSRCQELQKEKAQLSADQGPQEELDLLESQIARCTEKQADLVAPRPGTGDQPGVTPSEIDEGSSVEPNIAHLPRGVSVMLLEPFPLPLEGTTSLKMARLESLIWYPLLAFALIGLWRARSHLRVLLFPIVSGAGIVLMYALSEGNVGTAHRHRGEFVWVVVVLATLGLTSTRWWSTRVSSD